jgi:hypothetical protein
LFFPHYHFNEADPLQIQKMMRRCFQQWGLPKVLRLDNGRPLGDPQRSSVPELDLWFIGLGIEVKWNKPATPKENAKVERMQQTTANWAEVEKCCSCKELQQHLDQVALIQREHYSVRRLQGKSRKQCYSALWQNQRPYNSHLFNIGKVYKYLSQVTCMRKVSKSGFFTFYAQNVYIGTRYTAQTLAISFDSNNKRFLVSEPSKKAFAFFSADNFTAKAIQTLQVCRLRRIKCSNLVSESVAKT